jgi:hypothetical protein
MNDQFIPSTADSIMNQAKVAQATVMPTDALSAAIRAETDLQISTAKAYPRDMQRVLKTIEMLATLDQETAEECFYVLKRGQGDDNKVIEGLSVRFAEIIASSYGNMRIATRIVANDGKKIVAQAICHDLESNLAINKEVQKRITYKNGSTYSDDMQIVTGNAASAVAFRNAVLAVIPKAITKAIVTRVKNVSLGKTADLATTRQKIVDAFSKISVTKDMLLVYLEKSHIDELDIEDVVTLRGTYNAIKEGTTTVEETFMPKPIPAPIPREEMPAMPKTSKAAAKAAVEPMFDDKKGATNG